MNILLTKHVSIKSKQKENKKKSKEWKTARKFLFFGISFCNQNLNKQAKHIES